MKPFNFGYSMKNIPICSDTEYLDLFVARVSQFVWNFRWYAWHHLCPEATSSDKECYGLKSRRTPPPYSAKNYGKHWELLKSFEAKICELARNIRFGPCSNDLQKKLRQDIERIKNTTELIIPADKTSNWYCLTPEEYDKHLRTNITKDYRKTDYSAVDEINQRTAAIATSKGLSDRMQVIHELASFCTIKDHKDNFPNIVATRLLNPAKTDLGIISKKILENINREVTAATGLNLWRDNDGPISWFSDLEKKQSLKFLIFDIVDYYPSITEDLLLKALSWAKQHCDIPDSDIDCIMEARANFLFYRKNGSDDMDVYVKKNQAKNFDNPQGSFDSAECCELCGLFLLNELTKIVPADALGLYRDDGLIAVDLPGPDMDKLRKELHDLFKLHGLRTTAVGNLKQANYLDLTFDLEGDLHRPYRKPNDKPCYVHAQSNHPPACLKAVPQNINHRLSKLSSSKEIFDQEAPMYQDALEKSGHNHRLEYKKVDMKKKQRKRRRRVLWFNPPYSAHVKTPVGKRFFWRSFEQGPNLMFLANSQIFASRIKKQRANPP